MDEKQGQPKQETKKKPARKPGFWDNPWSAEEVQIDDGIWRGPNPLTHSWKPEYGEPVEE